MDIPILGTVDLTPSGIFLFVAGVIAIGYFGWQIFGTGRPGRDADAPADKADQGDKDEPTAR